MKILACSGKLHRYLMLMAKLCISLHAGKSVSGLPESGEIQLAGAKELSSSQPGALGW
jgi:hypothetical protein